MMMQFSSFIFIFFSIYYRFLTKKIHICFVKFSFNLLKIT